MNGAFFAFIHDSGVATSAWIFRLFKRAESAANYLDINGLRQCAQLLNACARGRTTFKVLG
jgi:hypothetical protein